MIARALAFLLLAATPVQAEDLVVLLSTQDVAITSTYTGARVTVFGLIDLRFHRQLEAVFLNDAAVGLGHRVLDDIGHDRFAVHPLEVGRRNLAGTETVDFHLGLKLLKLGVQAALKVGGRNRDLKLALQSFGEGLGKLHVEIPVTV